MLKTPLTRMQFTQTHDGLETVAYVHISIPVTLIFDEGMPTQEEVIQDALENFLVHPALQDVEELKNYARPILLEATHHCDVCDGKQYLISMRDDGREAVERCDACSEDVLDDEQAAQIAIANGVNCSPTYPCVTFPKETK